MRPIDAEPIEQALFKLADKSLAKSPYENARICAFRRAFELILNAPTIAPPPNDLLTMEQLLEMDGEPVWVIPVNGKYFPKWMIVDTGTEVCSNPDRSSAKFKTLGKTWNAYRHKPEG